MYKVLERNTMPDGTQIVLEDWSEKNSPAFPHLYGLKIAAFPRLARGVRKDSSQPGALFRVEIGYNSYAGYTNKRVREDFYALVHGEKRLEDLADFFCDPKDKWRLGMEAPVQAYESSWRQPIRTIKEQDALLEKLWEKLEDIPMNPDTESIETDFFAFPAGTKREDIWHWFDERYSKGVAHLLCCADGVDRADVTAKLIHLRTMCFECESQDCVYNKDGECRYAMVNEKAPEISEENGCESGEVPSLIK